MKKLLLYAASSLLIMSYTSGCSAKYGCPANGKSVGAERVLSGEKVPKAKSFKN